MNRAAVSKARTVTSRDVARAANVSQALVSRAFTGNGRIAPDTRERILKVAAEIGWQPNALAAGMVTGDAPLVAVITTRLSFEWRAQVLSHLLSALQEWHIKPLLFYAESDDEVDRLLVETIAWRTRGVIVTAGNIVHERAEAILERGQFFAALNRPANHRGAFAIATDNPLGGAMAAGLLMREGRRRYLVLAGLEGGWAASERTSGFVDALRDAGHVPLIWHSQGMTIDVGKACAAAFLELPVEQRPEAVFSTNDAMALGFYDGLRGTGVRIPDDLSLIGFDNLSASSWTPYQLTTFEQPLDAMVGQLLHHIDSHRREDGGTAAPASTGQRLGDDGVVYCAPTLIPRLTCKGQA